jgi:UDP-N-acetylglucosamine--N-acetylmuramyl-(pentapeptide) pyrophosphoryl-undecaprenol N-acetylglucosamine transferase
MDEALTTLPKTYVAKELLTDEMPEALAAADVVVCRAGMGTITELAALRKPAIVVPLPKSPQLQNARALIDARAAIVQFQEQTSPEDLKRQLARLLEEPELRSTLSERIATVLPTDVAGALVRDLESITR